MSPLFSIVVAVQETGHLLSLTLDSIRAQTEKGLEVLLLDRGGCGHLAEVARQYPFCRALSATDMNEALAQAKGKYLQFLSPGDRFISQQALEYLRELIGDSQFPHLVYSGCLVPGSDGLPQAVSWPLNRETLEKGTFPTAARSSWFLRQSLQEAGGFCPDWKYRASFDVLCRLFLKQGIRAVYSRRVLTDSEPYPMSVREMMGYAVETCRILYRHFGLWRAVRWIFVQDHLRMLPRALGVVKRAFLGRE
jgi:hypothetical protein